MNKMKKIILYFKNKELFLQHRLMQLTEQYRCKETFVFPPESVF